MWANRIALHWDLYLDHHYQNLPELLRANMLNIKFKDYGVQVFFYLELHEFSNPDAIYRFSDP